MTEPTTGMRNRSMNDVSQTFVTYTECMDNISGGGRTCTDTTYQVGTTGTTKTMADKLCRWAFARKHGIIVMNPLLIVKSSRIAGETSFTLGPVQVGS